MKATDLMIGDWVLCDGKPYQVAEISAGLLRIDAERKLFADPEDVEPIPLTAETLDKNGWKWGESWGAFVNDNSPIQFEHGTENNRFWWVEHNGLIAPINAVHELQHALRLCGIEKEVTL